MLKYAFLFLMSYILSASWLKVGTGFAGHWVTGSVILSGSVQVILRGQRVRLGVLSAVNPFSKLLNFRALSSYRLWFQYKIYLTSLPKPYFRQCAQYLLTCMHFVAGSGEGHRRTGSKTSTSNSARMCPPKNRICSGLWSIGWLEQFCSDAVLALSWL